VTPRSVVRNNGGSRLLHAGLASLTLSLLGTGWWLRAGQEGRPSLLARAVDVPDTELHRRAGWALAALALVAVTLGARGAARFGRETLRVDRGDGTWLRRWPAGAVTGRFADHRGHFDPGQRLANLGFVVTLVTLVVTGVALTATHGGPSFVWLVRVHRLAGTALTALVIGHVALAIGALPGYRGAWRAMGLAGRVPVATARRLWPATADVPSSPTDAGDRTAPREAIRA
jgi:formate dehydrogenase subunit gamma